MGEVEYMGKWASNICIVTALDYEARPLIEHYGLSGIKNPYFRIYGHEDIILIISGVGKICSSIATTYMLSNIGDIDHCAVINVGLCGAQDRKHSLGMPILINKIVDADTSYEYFPDIFFSHDMVEGGLETHGSQVSGIYIGEEFVDMEASGFFEAASTFLPPHRISCIKVVSDHIDGCIPKKNELMNMIDMSIPHIDNVCKAMRYNIENAVTVLDANEKIYLERIAKRLRFTVSQTYELYDMAFKYKLRTGKGLPSLEYIFDIQIESKEEVKREFEKLKEIFWSK